MLIAKCTALALFVFLAHPALHGLTLKLRSGDEIEVEIVEAKYAEAVCTKNASPYVLKYADVDMAWLKENIPDLYNRFVEGRNKAIEKSNAKMCEILADILIESKYGPEKRFYFDPKTMLSVDPAKMPPCVKPMVKINCFSKLLDNLNAANKPGDYKDILLVMDSSSKTIDKLTGKEIKNQSGILHQLSNDPVIIQSHPTSIEVNSRIKRIHQLLQNATKDTQESIRTNESLDESIRKSQKENIRKALIDLVSYVETLGVKPYPRN